MTIDGAVKWTWNDHEMIMKHCEDEMWDVKEVYLCFGAKSKYNIALGL